MKHIAALLLSLLSLAAWGDTIVADSNSYTDVQSAINAASVGDTVSIPSGTPNWGSNYVTINKGIILDGGGEYAVNATTWADEGTWPLTITTTSGSPIRIDGATTGTLARVTGIAFSGSVTLGTVLGGAVVVYADTTIDWRVDNCYFGVTGNAVAVEASRRGGLVDHVYSYDTTTAGTSGIIMAQENRYSDNGGWAFTTEVGFGTDAFVFVEDSTFYRTGTSYSGSYYMMDAQAGGCVVLRYNKIRSKMAVWHGSGTGYPQRSGYAFEIYENEFRWDGDDRYYTAIFHRGGAAVIYDNSFTDYQLMWKSWVERLDNSTGFGDVDGTQVHDGNWGGAYPTGYPALDQVGRGVASGATLATVQPQAEQKTHIWSNTLTNTGGVGHNNATYVVDGRDYEYSTDDTAALSGYSAYTYPHPLQGESGESPTGYFLGGGS